MSPDPDQPRRSGMACEDVRPAHHRVPRRRPARRRAIRVDDHLDGCDGCRNVLAQWRTVIALAGRLTQADVDNTDDMTRDRLISTIRGLRRR